MIIIIYIAGIPRNKPKQDIHLPIYTPSRTLAVYRMSIDMSGYYVCLDRVAACSKNVYFYHIWDGLLFVKRNVQDKNLFHKFILQIMILGTLHRIIQFYSYNLEPNTWITRK